MKHVQEALESLSDHPTALVDGSHNCVLVHEELDLLEVLIVASNALLVPHKLVPPTFYLSPPQTVDTSLRYYKDIHDDI